MKYLIGLVFSLLICGTTFGQVDTKKIELTKDLSIVELGIKYKTIEQMENIKWEKLEAFALRIDPETAFELTIQLDLDEPIIDKDGMEWENLKIEISEKPNNAFTQAKVAVTEFLKIIKG